MPLALESEWGNRDEVFYDFQNLLLSRADLRVMVYGYAKEKNKDGVSTCQKLEDCFETFDGSMEGDHYLLCCWNDEENSKNFHFHNFKIGPLGRAVNFGSCKSCP